MAGFGEGFRRVVRPRAFGGRATESGGTSSFGGSDLSAAARLAATQPGLSRAEFEAAYRELPTGSASIGVMWNVYRQLTSETGGPLPTSAEEVTSPEPEGPGRFQATRPGDLLGAEDLRFG